MALIRGSQISGSVASASYALTASYALNSSGTGFPFSGSASITGSLTMIGPVIITGSFQIQPSDTSGDVFIIKNSLGQNLVTVSQSGVVQFATQSTDPVGTPNPGAIWFTSASFFVGLE